MPKFRRQKISSTTTSDDIVVSDSLLADEILDGADSHEVNHSSESTTE